ncbi:hypothetical protein [Cytobacillus firmus]|uniref:hypothetical protein n=1 Tax=Cytobacillus firmus TaxID=1399 RepID=UPI0018CE60EF|nr:hypothetical protein [Cytobacillus firmus]MBG9657105.1 hypothetical protein [Cytobacillus firmus]MED1906781.1 hypothetical protein [Cytobacillus firmus]
MSKITVVFVNQDNVILQREVYHDTKDESMVERFAKETRQDLLNTGKHKAVGFFLEYEVN